MSNLRPRLCVLEKGPRGYGFHLHGEKGKFGQFIRLVEDDTPAAAAGLLAGDRLMFVNGQNVEGDSHQQVVSRIRATTGALTLIVVDADTGELLRKHNLKCREEFVTEGIPVPGAKGGNDSDREDAHSNGTPRRASAASQENGETSSERSRRLSVSSSNKEDGLRPRLCVLKKGSTGYGFNLHSEKTRPGQFIRAVDDDSPAQKAGLRTQDKIIQVNGTSVVGMQHSEVVALIKAGGDETSLLVVDTETEEFFKRCNIVPSEDHVSGPLPEPMSERTSVEEEPVMATSKLSSSASSTSSNNSLLPQNEAEPETSGSLGLGLSLAEVRERAQKKRESKKAPTMDWRKRNELFSNL